MEYTVNRLLKSDECWIGTLEEAGTLKYYFMDLGLVPPGRYKLTKYFSPDHNAYVPLVNDVPGHEGIEIHVGNYPEDTKGCGLLGLSIEGANFIGHSKVAVDEFYNSFFALVDKGTDCFITYKEYK